MEPTADLLAATIGLRHRLHAIPETAFAEEATAALIRTELDRLGIAWRRCAGTGTVATIGPVSDATGIACRAEMDALEIVEATGLPYASSHPGRMHACGHDGHLAALLGLATWAQAHAGSLRRRLHLIFQPGEEGAGGAVRMIGDGALDGIGELYAWHNWPGIGDGVAVCPDGCLMGANGHYRAVITGVGGHAALPARCRNPLATAARFILRLPELVAARRADDPQSVLGVSTCHAGTRENVIPDTAVLEGTVRAPTTDRCRRLADLARDCLAEVCAADGVAGGLTYFPHYVATVNAPDCAAALRAAWCGTVPGGTIRDGIAPLPVSEDFGFYLERIPGAMLLAGTGRPAPLHTAGYDFDDGLLRTMLGVLLRLLGLRGAIVGG
jgi:hippurate hydrolase